MGLQQVVDAAAQNTKPGFDLPQLHVRVADRPERVRQIAHAPVVEAEGFVPGFSGIVKMLLYLGILQEFVSQLVDPSLFAFPNSDLPAGRVIIQNLRRKDIRIAQPVKIVEGMTRLPFTRPIVGLPEEFGEATLEASRPSLGRVFGLPSGLLEFAVELGQHEKQRRLACGPSRRRFSVRNIYPILDHPGQGADLGGPRADAKQDAREFSFKIVALEQITNLAPAEQICERRSLVVGGARFLQEGPDIGYS